jgi:hypothetical protein
MLKKIALPVLAAAAFMIGIAGFAFAEGGKFTGKITQIQGERVTVKVEGAVPAWARAGVVVKSGGGAPRVLRVSGSDVTLKFGKSKAELLKVDQVLEIAESSGEAVQGC